MNGTEQFREAYVDAIMKRIANGQYNLTNAVERAIVAEIEQFLVDMMDCCAQSGVAEPAIVAACNALRAYRDMGVSITITTPETDTGEPPVDYRALLRKPKPD